MKSHGNHEKNGSPLHGSITVSGKTPNLPTPNPREKHELRWVGRDPETVNNSTRSRFCLFVSRLSHYSDPFIVWWNYSSVFCVGDGHG